MIIWKYLKLLLFFVIIYITASCSRKYLVNYSGVKFENITFTSSPDRDSLFLSLKIVYAPKSFGKKAIMVITPIIINDADTLKFKTIVHGGCGYDDDCDCIGYETSTVKAYHNLPSYSSQHYPVKHYLPGTFKLMILTSGDKNQPFVGYQSLLEPKEIFVN